ncbi:MAG: DEAD/DEAH box helicase [Treponema sp.]|nr:DEAD/DEAH box helicase [Treponema sp.]
MTNNFNQLGAAPDFIKQLEERNIRDATDIQSKIIPLLMSGESVFFASATGTGKTFAYLLPLLGQMLEKSSHEGAELLITSPTLELCTQIKGELDFLLKDTDIQSSLLIGSVNIERQIENLRKTKPAIIVGNPNRLLVLAKKRIIKFSSLRFLVLDEADRLVSDEMLDETRELLKLIGRDIKRTNTNLIITACSATMNKKNREKLLDSLSVISNMPEIPFIESDANEILRDKIEHWAIFSEKRRKDQTLRSLIAALKGKKSRFKTLVFTSKGDEAALVLSRLQHHHVNAAGLFGKTGKKPLASQERKVALDSFRTGKVNVLVCTDLAARGLDIPGITHVIALDVPADSEVYIHRCGRTGRAGKRGTMITIGDETQMFLLASMEKKLKIRVQPKELYYGQVNDPAPIED